MAQFSRREILKLSLYGAGGLAILPPNILRAAPLQSSEADDHFYLQLIIQGGADTSYLFDARPLAMRRAGKIQNYLGEEAEPWAGTNGGTCLTTSTVAALKPFKNDFSVINGVVMTPNFIGHDQNMNQLFAGNEFGGASFVPQLNLGENGARPKSLDAITNGFLFANLDNLSSSVPLDAQSGDKLRAMLATLPPASPENEVISFIRSRYVQNSLGANGRGRGRFAQGTGLMLRGLDRSPELHKVLRELRSPKPGESPELQFCGLLADCFRLGVSRSAVWVLNQNQSDVDSHGPDQAKQMPRTIKGLAEKVATVIKFLKETPFDERRSLFDVTTVLLTSEFGRTMRNPSMPIDNTGTDHNSLVNSVLIGGKGIRGGLVVGASDFQTAGEKLSPAHLALDQEEVKLMGRPFDFKTWTPRSDLPAKFLIGDYLTIGSVVNTVFKNFGCPETRYHRLGRNLPAAPPLDVLLKS